MIKDYLYFFSSNLSFPALVVCGSLIARAIFFVEIGKKNGNERTSDFLVNLKLSFFGSSLLCIPFQGWRKGNAW